MLLGSGALGTLFVGEVVVRQLGFDEVYRQGLYRPSVDPELGYEFTPDHHSRSYGAPVAINAMGYRQPPFAVERAPDTYRIVCVGDSFTFGMGVRQEESWPAQLAAAMEPPPGYARVEVINAGVPGYNLKQDCRHVETKLLAFQPNLILIGLVENDLEKPYYVENGYLCVPRKKTTLPIPGKRWLQTHSDLYQAINMRYQGWVASRLKVYNPRLAREILCGDTDPQKWAAAVAQLSDCRTWARARGSELRVVLLAIGAQSPLPDIVRRAEVPARALSLDDPHLRLADGHPNAQGHAFFAAQIAAWLRLRPGDNR